MLENNTYLVPRFDYNPFYDKWDAYIEERTSDGDDITIMAWHLGQFHTAHQALEAVTNEWVRMSSNTLQYHGVQ